MTDASPHFEIYTRARGVHIGQQTINLIAGNQYQVANGRKHLILQLDPIFNASHTRDRGLSPPDSACFPGTRTKVIQGIISWVDSGIVLSKAPVVHIYWFHGFAGSGKSAISLEIAKIYAGSERLLASFFFFRNSGDRSRMNKFAATLAAQMAAAVPATTTFIQAALDAEPGLLTDGVSLTVQLERLVYAPFQAALEQGLDLSGGPFVIVIDGLDECEDKQGVVNFIDHALNFFKEHPSIPLRLFIASRVEEHIRSRLESEQVILSDLNSHSAHGDIELFLRASFRSAAAKDRVIQSYVRAHGEWPTKLDMAKLIRHIKGSFVLAATIFKFIVQPATEEDPSTPMARLPLALEMNGLDGLYARTLARSQHLPHFHNIISTIALLERPLPIIGIARLLRIEAFEVAHVLLNLQAIIHVPGTDELGEVTLCHTSLLDFLATKSRSGPFFVPPSFHLHLSYYCFASIYEKPAHDYGNHFSLHWRAFAKAGVCDFIDEIEQFKAQACQSQHPVNRLPYHAFLCTLFLYSFSLRHWEIPVGVPYLLTECAEQLALAVEHPDHRIQSWLENQLSAALYFPFIQRMEQLTEDTYGRVKHSLERASNAIYAKFPGILEQHRQPTGRENEYTIGRVLPTGIDIFGTLEWTVARAQLVWEKKKETPQPPLKLAIAFQDVRLEMRLW